MWEKDFGFQLKLAFETEIIKQTFFSSGKDMEKIQYFAIIV